MNPFNAMVFGWIGAASLMLVMWERQRRHGNAAIVDPTWAFATSLLGVFFAVTASGNGSRRIAVVVVASLWGIRLTTYLVRRMFRDGGDGRYEQLRLRWGAKTQRNLFLFFQIQAIWALMFAAPMLASALNPRSFGWVDALGLVFCFIAIVGESVSDRQLERFKGTPANRTFVCRTGFWRYSRHPNYFFEWIYWWSYLCFTAGSEFWWIGVGGVVLMLFFLTKVTGIPTVEAQALRTRGDAYREYQRTTSAFVPWIPTEKLQ